ncbi:hypothetical protein F4825DRAFT_124731 [Nemania diffusa]|nr:hypothetical protein F4825DRAFT_124731 [Nemania diffusa]
MDSTHAEQHLVVSKNPFKCHCGMECKTLYTLQRHIRGQNKDALCYPCPECTAYQGRNGFSRKDHLKQHLIHGHGYDDHRLAAIFPSRDTDNVRRVCRFEDCEYNPRQKTNRRFAKQSEYTAHMKREHDWSPLACNVAGCEKSGGKGFFSISMLEKHRNQKHPGTTVPMPTVRDSVEKTLKCSYCLKQLGSKRSLRYHENSDCTAELECDLCHKLVQLGRLQLHKSYRCKGEVACLYCHKRMEACKLGGHERRECEGMTKCWICSKSVERRTMTSDLRSCKSCEK